MILNEITCTAQVLLVFAAAEGHQERPSALLFRDPGPAGLLRPAVWVGWIRPRCSRQWLCQGAPADPRTDQRAWGESHGASPHIQVIMTVSCWWAWWLWFIYIHKYLWYMDVWETFFRAGELKAHLLEVKIKIYVLVLFARFVIKLMLWSWVKLDKNLVCCTFKYTV